MASSDDACSVLDTSFEGREPCSRGDERLQFSGRQGSERASFSGRWRRRRGKDRFRPKWLRTPSGSQGSSSLRPSAKRRPSHLNQVSRVDETHSRDRTRQFAASRARLQAVDKPRVTTRPARLSSRGIAEAGFAALARPDSDEDLAFASIRHIGALLRSRKISSVELTKLYLARLRRYDPLLKCVVTFMDELALEQAKRADRELAEGKDRGALHGIPWGLKDIIAYPGYPTTWCARSIATASST